MVLLSIIIPAFNEQRYLPKLLKSIKAQSFKDYEIIVCDANSKDNTVKIARSFGCRVYPGGSPAIGRNSGAKHAKGSLLLFFDADIFLPNSGTLGKMISEFERRKLAVSTVKLIPKSFRKIDVFMHEFVHVYLKMLQTIKPSAGGGCLLVRKKIHDGIGGFDEKLYFAEDHDYVFRASKKGKFRLIDSVKVVLSVRRLAKEGRLNLIRKFAMIELYRFANKRIDRPIIPYEFGAFEKLSSKQRMKLRNKMREFLESYNKILSKLIKN
ncbi:MAG: glycosyltransferase [Nanoarchaeota archaeon]